MITNYFNLLEARGISERGFTQLRRVAKVKELTKYDGICVSNNSGGVHLCCCEFAKHSDRGTKSYIGKLSESVILAEGIYDMMSFLEVGINAVALCGANINSVLLKHLQNNHIKSVAICFDNDLTGRTQAEKSVKRLNGIGVRAINITSIVCDSESDPNDMLVMLGNEEFRTRVLEALSYGGLYD